MSESRSYPKSACHSSAFDGPSIGCIVLAAGASKRFGGEKLLARLADKALLQYAIDAASGSHALSCTLVLGAGYERIAASVDARRCAIALNPRWAQGIASSIACGLRLHRDDDACIVMLADQPRVGVDDLNALVEAFCVNRRGIVALRAGDIWGAPVLFPRRDFARVSALKGDVGAKRYVETQRSRTLFVDAARADAFTDVDTKEDLSRLARY
jgi:molybdenum cofactor cytidylyltransferase